MVSSNTALLSFPGLKTAGDVTTEREITDSGQFEKSKQQATIYLSLLAISQRQLICLSRISHVVNRGESSLFAMS